jgi:iron-sulfur cluster assembly accessory protein
MSTITPETTTGTDETTASLPEHEVKLSDVAAGKVRSLLEQEGRTDLRLRVAVQPGGCSGLIYQLYFDERVLDGDAVRDFDGVEVIVDKMSVPYLSGASIDFEDTISKQGSPSTTRMRAVPAPAATRSTKVWPRARGASNGAPRAPSHVTRWLRLRVSSTVSSKTGGAPRTAADRGWQHT